MSFHRLMVHSFLLSSIPLHVYGRKNNFPSTFLGSWLRPPCPYNKRQITGEKQMFNNMYTL